MSSTNRLYSGRYRALGQSFSGGGGIVEVCEDTNLDRKVAIKFLHTQAERRRIFDEIAALQRIRSKNVIDVYDIVVEKGGDAIGIVQEFLEGEDLVAFAKKPLKDQAYLKVLYQMANGLADIHEQGIIHRDIKPNNIKFGSEQLLKIFDFGLARDEQANAATYGFKGTLTFAAPEQYGQGFIAFTRQVDVYSLAVSALYLRNGALPPELTAVPPDPSRWIKMGGFGAMNLPSEIIQLLDAALSPHPDQRPEAAQLRDCLARLLLRGQHRALLVVVATGDTYELNAKRATVQLANHDKTSALDIRYTGMQFVVSSVSGDVSINNRAVQAGETIPGSCVIALGPASLGARRIFITVDHSHPEVVL